MPLKFQGNPFRRVGFFCPHASHGQTRHFRVFANLLQWEEGGTQYGDSEWSLPSTWTEVDSGDGTLMELNEATCKLYEAFPGEHVNNNSPCAILILPQYIAVCQPDRSARLR